MATTLGSARAMASTSVCSSSATAAATVASLLAIAPDGKRRQSGCGEQGD